VIPRALKFVRFKDIEDHFRLGWLVSFANEPMHHHHYGIELQWICNCPVPGGFKTSSHRVSETSQTESATHERAFDRT
jgi:hypothetical protein